MALNSRQIAPRKAFGRRVTSGQEPVAQTAPQARPRLAASNPQPEAAKDLFSEQTVAREQIAPQANFEARALPEAQIQDDRTLDTGEVIARSFALLARNGVTVMALIAAAAAPSRLVYHLGGQSLSPLVTMLGCLVLYGAVFHAAIRDVRGGNASFSDCLSAGLRDFTSAFGSIALTVMSVWLLLILPCIGLATGWAVAAPAALTEGLGLRAALARSVKLTAPHRPQVQVLVMLLGVLAISRSLLMMPIWGEPAQGLAAFLVGDWLFPLLLTGFAAASGAVLYQELARSAPAPAAAGPAGEQLALF